MLNFELGGKHWRSHVIQNSKFIIQHSGEAGGFSTIRDISLARGMRLTYNALRTAHWFDLFVKGTSWPITRWWRNGRESGLFTSENYQAAWLTRPDRKTSTATCTRLLWST